MILLILLILHPVMFSLIRLLFLIVSFSLVISFSSSLSFSYPFFLVLLLFRRCSSPFPGNDDGEKDRAAEGGVVERVGQLRHYPDPSLVILRPRPVEHCKIPHIFIVSMVA